MNQQRFEGGEKGEGNGDDLTTPDDDLATPDNDWDDLTIDPKSGVKVVSPSEDDLSDVSDLGKPEPIKPVPLSVDDVLGK